MCVVIFCYFFAPPVILWREGAVPRNRYKTIFFTIPHDDMRR